jgi:hypothetical protein
MVARRRKRTGKRLAGAGVAAMVDRSPNTTRETAMRPDRLPAAEREFVLDQILTDLWKGKLTREVAIGRIMAKLGMNQRAARDEVDGFLRD